MILIKRHAFSAAIGSWSDSCMALCAGLTVLGSNLYVAMGSRPLAPQNGTYGDAVIKLSTPDMVVSVPGGPGICSLLHCSHL